MTPWQEVRTFKVTDAPAALWTLAETTTWTRFPVVDDDGNVLGLINVVDALVHEVTDCPPIDSLMTDPVRVTRQMPLREVLALLQQRRRAMALVVGESDRPVGIVSIKDLVEPITGQLAEW
jgi:CBS domain containing-hemolysin-like protein